MRIEQLRQFVSIVRAGSINKAAKDLYIAQSTLSKSIRMLEQELHAPLLQRDYHGVSLTLFGQHYYTRALKLIEDFDYLQSLNDSAPYQSIYTLKVTSHPLKFVENVFIKIYKKYESENPQFLFHAQLLPASIADVKQGNCDIGISLFTSESINLNNRLLRVNNMEYTSIKRFPAFVMMRHGHPLTQGDPTSISSISLMNYSLTSFYGNFSKTDWEVLLGNCSTHRNSVWVSERECFASLIAQTNAYTIIPYCSAIYGEMSPFDENQICVVPLADDRFFFEAGWFRDKNHPLTPLALEFLDMLKTEMEK
ncbi:MAG: LysR family transcriptional regulator [Clostridiaceae bacterium]|nr:LysR family transcriptional regulator [Clostridiaceae bacterium]